MATLVDRERRLSIEPIGYQFPRADGGPSSRSYVGSCAAKWLRVRVDASDGTRSWTRIEPCFSDYELHDLSTWFAAAAGGATVPRFAPIEPCLEFEVAQGRDRVMLASVFDLELHPEIPPPYGAPYRVTFSVEHARLREFSAAIANELLKYRREVR